MLGFVRESRLIAEKNKVDSLEKELQHVNYELKSAKKEIESTEHLRSLEINDLNEELAIAHSKINCARKEVEALERKRAELEIASENRVVAETVTPYQYLADGPVSDLIKAKLEQVKEAQKTLILSGSGFEITTPIMWNDSLAMGKAKQKRHGKFLITAFNAEVDNIISKTTARNFASSSKKIEKWFDQPFM